MASRGWIALHAALAVAAASFATKTANATDCTNDTQCAGTRTPRCIMPYGICGCENDQQCGGATSGLICTGTRPGPIGLPPFCTAGCGSPADRNKCTANETCTAPSGGTGACDQDCLLSGTACLGNALLNKCAVLTGGSLTQCVECNTSADCAGKVGAEVCSGSTKRCIQCNADTDCTGKPNGKKCRTPDQSCGCNDDSNCTTGRICNATIHACLPGCRIGADGGSDCPPGTECNATGGGAGQCVPPVDGGPGDGSTGDGSTGDGSTGDGSAGDGSAGDGSTGDGSAGDGSTGDGSADGGDGGGGFDGGTDAGNNGNENDGNYGTSLEGGGCDCSITPAEDSLPIGGLLAVGGFFAFVTRRRAKKNNTQQTQRK